MKILVIGGTGHTGRFLVPMLVERGDEVIVVSRGRSGPGDDDAWRKVEMITAQCASAPAPADKAWTALVEQTAAEVIIDIPSKAVADTYQAAKRSLKHYIACGSIWMYGPPRTIPTPEATQGPCLFEAYAARYAELLATLKQAGADGIAFTGIMPPNICGPGKIPLEGCGGRSADVHKAHMQGKPVKLPRGCNTVISPCDASDVARGYELIAANRDAAAGEIFNVGSEYGLTAPQFIAAYGRIYSTEIPINYVDVEEFYSSVMPELGANYHFREHMLPDTAKARSKLGYRPQFTPEQTMARGVEWMRREQLI
ncbi:MAG: NAD(P)-dependent oxidoreductase [Planctomycetes bacterium]|nr:NAD(P)-dependent oxidoreductase [Planctomycetota bacterium]